MSKYLSNATDSLCQYLQGKAFRVRIDFVDEMRWFFRGVYNKIYETERKLVEEAQLFDDIHVL